MSFASSRERAPGLVGRAARRARARAHLRLAAPELDRLDERDRERARHVARRADHRAEHGERAAPLVREEGGGRGVRGDEVHARRERALLELVVARRERAREQPRRARPLQPRGRAARRVEVVLGHDARHEHRARDAVHPQLGREQRHDALLRAPHVARAEPAARRPAVEQRDEAERRRLARARGARVVLEPRGSERERERERETESAVV